MSFKLSANLCLIQIWYTNGTKNQIWQEQWGACFWSNSFSTWISDPILYRTIVDYHTYLKTTPPDIFNVIQVVIQSMSNPRHVHRSVVLHITQYLQRSSRCVILFFKGSSMQLTTYDDIDWAGCPNTCQSRTSWCLFREFPNIPKI